MSLATIIAGTTYPEKWALYPSLAYLRDSLVHVLDPGSLTGQEQGDAVMLLGQLTEVYNVCDRLHAEVRSATPVTRQSFQNVYRNLNVSRYLNGALADLNRLGTPPPHLALLESYATSPLPLNSVSGIATIITLAAILMS
jgi:hypothetical protein